MNHRLTPEPARVAELADALDLGSSGQPWGFESPLSHHGRLKLSRAVGSEVVVRMYHEDRR